MKPPLPKGREIPPTPTEEQIAEILDRVQILPVPHQGSWIAEDPASPFLRWSIGENPSAARSQLETVLRETITRARR